MTGEIKTSEIIPQKTETFQKNPNERIDFSKFEEKRAEKGFPNPNERIDFSKFEKNKMETASQNPNERIDFSSLFDKRGGDLVPPSKDGNRPDNLKEIEVKTDSDSKHPDIPDGAVKTIADFKSPQLYYNEAESQKGEPIQNKIETEKSESATQKVFYDAEGNQYKTDDSGKIYSKNGELLPNNTYELNGYKYTTDEKGRIIKVEGNLQLPESKPRQSLPDIPDRKSTDDRGHLIAHEFGGDDTEGNLVPMDAEVNRNGEYRKLENELRKLKEEGHDVNVTIEPQYEGDSKRPTEFVISYDVDGEHYEKVIKNESSKGE